MRALFVVPEYLPYGGAVANIVRKIITFDNSDAIRYDVLSLKLNDSIEKDGIYTVDNVNSYRTKEAFKHIKNVSDLCEITAKILKKVFCVRKNKWINTYTVKSFCDRMYKLEKNNHYDVIIPVVASPCMFEAVKCLKKNKGYNGKIIVFQVDPISGNQYHDPLVSEKWLEYERLMYETADRVIIHPVQYHTSPLLKKHPELIDMVEVMEWPMIQNSESVITSESSSDDRIVCFFSGYLDDNIRSPEYCMKLIDKIDDPRIKFDFFSPGKRELILKYTSSDVAQRVCCHDAVSLDECLRLMQQADALINIGNNCANQMPSKLFDYINTGKPIINICKSRNCPTIEYMNRYPMALNIFEDEDVADNARLTERFIIDNLNKTVTYEKIENAFFECTNAFVLNRFNEVIKEK